VFFTVTVWAALVPPLVVVKVRVAGVNEIGLVMPVAAEVSFTTSGGAPARSVVTMMAPLSVADVGVTCTVTVQLAPAVSESVKQVPVSIW